ncbi:MAG: polysaccharide biosynthesis tyrosine autokinase [Actinomycetota bacterium]
MNGFGNQTDRGSARDTLGLLRFRKWSISFIVLVVVGLAIFMTRQQPPTFSSAAEVLVRPGLQAATAPTSAPVNLETETRLAQSRNVLELAHQKLNGQISESDLSRGISISNQPETEILIFSFTSLDEALPQKAAQAFAAAYLSFRGNQLKDELIVAQEALQERIDEAKQQLHTITENLADTDDAAEEALLRARQQSVTGRIAVLEQQATALPTVEAAQIGQIVQSAGSPSISMPNVKRNAVMALLVGLMLGIGSALLRDTFDDRPRSESDLELHAGALMFAAVPRTTGRKKNRPLLAVDDYGSAAAEAYRTLRANVLFAAGQRALRTIMVTSPQPDEGKTTTVANLGVSLARMGKRVILISSDLRRPRLHALFEKNNAKGLADVLREGRDPLPMLLKTKVDGLLFMPSGSLVENPSEVLEPKAMRKVISRLASSADIILLDAAPLLPVADAMTLAPATDAVLLVCDAAKTTRKEIIQARQRLDQVEATVVGCVLNRFDPTDPRNSSYTSGYNSYGPHPTPGNAERKEAPDAVVK